MSGVEPGPGGAGEVRDAQNTPDLSRPHEAAGLAEAEREALEAHAAAYALEALTPAEAQAFTAHLAGCAFCRAAAAEMAAVADVLPLSVAPVPADPALKERLMAAVRAEMDAAPVVESPAVRASGAGARVAGPATFLLPHGDSRRAVEIAAESAASRSAGPGIGEQAQAMQTPPAARAAPARGSWFRQTPQWLTAVLLVACVGLGAWNVALLRGAAAERERAAAYEAALAAAAGGRVVQLAAADGGAREARLALIAPGSGTGGTGEARLLVAGLPEAPADRTYQLWLIQDGTPRDAGTFSGSGRAVQTVPVRGNADRAQVVAVTVEPRGGSQAPTSQPIYAGRL